MLWGKARDDLIAARATLATGKASGVVCFLAQQAAEKSLKSLLALHGVSYEPTHILSRLIAEVRRELTNVAIEDVRISGLQPYAVGVRYDDAIDPDELEAEEALRTAEALHAQVGIVIDSHS